MYIEERRARWSIVVVGGKFRERKLDMQVVEAVRVGEGGRGGRKGLLRRRR